MKIFKSLIFYLLILIFFIAFNFTDTPPPGWYQQFMPYLGGRSIVDITFTDSLRGYAITNEVSDTSFILRTTNGGDNWFFSHYDNGVASYYNIQFINPNTGFVSGYIYDGSLFKIVKTTNGGANWFYINSAFDVVAVDMHVLNQDTIWLADAGLLTGGLFRTTNGGANWIRQYNNFSLQPEKVYMFNSRIGFISRNNAYLRKTTDGGSTWTIDTTGNDSGFREMYFVDSLTGWKTYYNMRKTTNGGLNWYIQTTPQGGIIQSSFIYRFSNVSRDTI
jgi:photosystem II stability/assembly factor-like uncharacterized protein